MAHKTLVSGTAYEIGGGRTLIDGTAYSIDKGRTLVDGTGYDISFGTPIGSLAVGSSVFFNVNGTPYEFIVVHQGNPDSSMYDASCDGTWLMAKNSLDSSAWDADDTRNYGTSDIHIFLNDSILGLFDTNIQSAIKDAVIPYCTSRSAVRTGSDGLSTKLFLLSGYEVGWTTETFSDFPIDGACLDYFYGLSNVNSKRICYRRTGIIVNWWLRSVATFLTSRCFRVNTDGGYSYSALATEYDVRPAFILPSDFDVTNYLA